MQERENREREDAPLGTENAAMPQDEGVSEIKDTAAMKRSIAFEQKDDLESGGVKEQQEYLRWERKMDQEEAEEEE